MPNINDTQPLPLLKIMDKYGYTKHQREMDSVDRMLFELSSIAGVTFPVSSWPAMRNYVRFFIKTLDQEQTL
jgi:hypothetical protein